MVDVAARFREPLVLDGGLASQLEGLGADLSDELWSARLLLDDPQLVRRVHEIYYEAGADVAISASYQASFDGFGARGIGRDDAARLLRRSVELAREAAEGARRHGDRPPLVAASVGPYGAVLADGSEYDGRYGRTVEELAAFHEPRLDVLLSAAPDLLAVETIPSVVETEALARLLDLRPEARAWVTFTCRDDRILHDGTPIADAAEIVASVPAVVAVGVNCSPPGNVEALLRRVRERLPDTPLVAYPNLGSTWDPDAKVWRADGPRPDFEAGAAAWRASGATAIGGCCGTGPDDVAAVARVLRGDD